MKNLLAFFECCYKNLITRIGFMLILSSIALFLSGLYILSFIAFAYGIISAALTGFGFGSYFYFKRTTNILIHNHACEKPYKYCLCVGYQIALKRFNKRFCS